MLYTTILIAFLIGYFFIAFEHSIKVDKAVVALLTGTICWVLLVFALENGSIGFSEESVIQFIPESIRHHIGDISEILFFLMGAMTIVEIIDAHEGFTIITEKISTTKRVKLIWILSIVTFFLSAASDNPNNRYRDVCSIKENDCRQKRFMAVCRYVDYCSQCRWSVVSNR